MSNKDKFNFLCGFVIAVFFTLQFFGINQSSNEDLISREIQHTGDNSSLSDYLFKEVKVLCFVMTHPPNHKTRAVHVKKTWGRRCNKLLFMSSTNDSELDTVALDMQQEGRGQLWVKTRKAVEYIYKHHLNDADWFLKADDDSYFIMENLRYFLYRYRSQTSYLMGTRFAAHHNEGFMSGGGYVLSKKAVVKLVEELFNNSTICNNNDYIEDSAMGKCLQKHAIFVDMHDDLMEKQFFADRLNYHFEKKMPENFWYTDFQYFNHSQGNLNCCSKYFIGRHYVKSASLYFHEDLIYNFHPFGLETAADEVLPNKLNLSQIINQSDTESFSKLFKKHQPVHLMDNDEIL